MPTPRAHCDVCGWWVEVKEDVAQNIMSGKFVFIHTDCPGPRKFESGAELHVIDNGDKRLLSHEYPEMNKPLIAEAIRQGIKGDRKLAMHQSPELLDIINGKEVLAEQKVPEEDDGGVWTIENEDEVWAAKQAGGDPMVKLANSTTGRYAIVPLSTLQRIWDSQRP